MKLGGGGGGEKEGKNLVIFIACSDNAIALHLWEEEYWNFSLHASDTAGWEKAFALNWDASH